MVGCTLLRQISRGGFPQAVGCAAGWQTGGYAKIPEVIAETGRREGLALCGDQERQVVARRHRIDRGLQPWHDFHIERDRSSGGALTSCRYGCAGGPFGRHRSATVRPEAKARKPAARAFPARGIFELSALPRFPRVVPDRLHAAG